MFILSREDPPSSTEINDENYVICMADFRKKDENIGMYTPDGKIVCKLKSNL